MIKHARERTNKTVSAALSLKEARFLFADEILL